MIEMGAAIVNFNDVVKDWNDLTSKQMRTALLRTSDTVASIAITKAAARMDEGEKPYFKKRARGILKDMRGIAKRMRARFMGDAAVTTSGSRREYVLPVEYGGTYRQWVHTYAQTRTTAWGVPLKRPHTVTISKGGGFRRNRTEAAHGWIGAAWDDAARVATEILRRAFQGLIDDRKVPGQRALKKGLL